MLLMALVLAVLVPAAAGTPVPSSQLTPPTPGSSSAATTVAMESETGWWRRPSFACSGVLVKPGELEAKVDSRPAGTTFCLRPGLHRLTGTVGKEGNRYVGKPGAIVSGAIVLRSWQRSGSYWVAQAKRALTNPNPVSRCEVSLCEKTEDLYVNDVSYQQVGDIAGVRAGTFLFDYATDRVYIFDDPRGKRVELTHVGKPFANAEVVRGLTVEKFANPSQHCALCNGLIEGNEIRFNHGIGVNAPRIINNWIHHQGQLGMAASRTTGARVQGNEVDHNNTLGYWLGWEAGGSKFAFTTRLTIRNNYVHDNFGPGLWMDIDNIHALVEANTVEGNVSSGIEHEIGYDAVIRNNVSRFNGLDARCGQCWGAGILVANSSNVQVLDNLIEGNKRGIILFQADRGAGRYGPYIVRNVTVDGNELRQTGRTGFEGVVDLSSNGFERNRYLVPDTGPHWYINGAPITWEQWQGSGMDVNGHRLVS